MSILRRKPATEVTEAPADAAPADERPTTGKGRPTPKRRTGTGPVTPAPKTRKEAIAWQKKHASNSRVAGQKQLTPAEQREAMRTGQLLQPRDRGPVRALARDYVDSRRMASNYVLWVFPAMLLSFLFPPLQYLELVAFLVLLVEGYLSGTRVKRLARERGLESRDTAVSIGFYSISRAFFKRSWRRPLPTKQIGDPI